MDELWPVRTIRVRSDRLELTVATETDLADLARLAARGIYNPLNQHIPRSPVSGWSDLPSLEAERSFLRYYWQSLADWKPERWTLLMAMKVDGCVIGVQEVGAKDFKVSRTVSTGSWIGREFQRKGYGKEMRLAILHLAFLGLGAEYAESAAWETNAPSLGVSRSLGYAANGFAIRAFNGTQQKQINLIIGRNDFKPDPQRFTIDGLTRDALEFMDAS